MQDTLNEIRPGSQGKVNKAQVTLNEIRPGERCVAQKVMGEGAVRRRLFDMGLTPGADILVRKVAPLGDPMELTVRGYELSVRKVEAELVIVEKK